MTHATDEFEPAVRLAVHEIPRGEISTYGEIAAEAGYPGAARAVGNVLRMTTGLPWWRVVTTTGRLLPGKESDHASRLRAEGIRVENGRVQMSTPR